ncbi:MAG: hypothetical protein M3P06_25170, partial [Acidobacteriota bacterium]|nr:hypothetical protein [Acidobacteriota bacterium]
LQPALPAGPARRRPPVVLPNDLDELASCDVAQCALDPWKQRAKILNAIAHVSDQNDTDSNGSKVLLMTKRLVGGDHDLEASVDGRTEQDAVS